MNATRVSVINVGIGARLYGPSDIHDGMILKLNKHYLRLVILLGFMLSSLTIYGYSQATATPTFSPAAGTYSSAQTVHISDVTTGSSIFYTTDGTTPTGLPDLLYQ